MTKGTTIPTINGIREKYYAVPATYPNITIDELIQYILKGNKPLCPLCGMELKCKTARRGVRTGKEFWGCSTFPACEYVLNIEDV